jgi:RHS repeat-associated protein
MPSPHIKSKHPPHNLHTTKRGYQGSERDDDVKGEGNSHTTFYRMHDPRLGRWFSVDPLANKYPGMSPYNFVSNCPIRFVDNDGRVIWDPIAKREVIYNNESNKFEYKGKPNKELSAFFVENSLPTLSVLSHSNVGKELIGKMQVMSTKIVINENDESAKADANVVSNSTVVKDYNEEGAPILNSDGLYKKATIVPIVNNIQSNALEDNVSFEEKLIATFTVEIGHISSKNQNLLEHNLGSSIYKNSIDFAKVYTPLVNDAVANILKYRNEKNISIDETAFSGYKRIKETRNKDGKRIGGGIILNNPNWKEYEKVKKN